MRAVLTDAIARTGSTAPVERITERSTKFCSSLTLPGYIEADACCAETRPACGRMKAASVNSDNKLNNCGRDFYRSISVGAGSTRPTSWYL
jgi:hypothetical protein